MMLSKLSRSIASASHQLNKNDRTVRAVILLGASQKRNFSIDKIGKYEHAPYDYKSKQYGLIGQFSDSTLKRLGENSLIITVDGNFGSGKSEFAQKLAKEIDFVYAREPDLDTHLYDLPNGFNVRKIINEITESNERFHVDNLEEWHRNPSFKKTIALQHSFYNIRWMQTRTALLHLLSTGQGVVLERSVFSDSVIAQSLYENNFLSDQAMKFYLRDLVPNTITELWRPHVCIYVDKPPEECLENIKKNGKPFEKESKVYNIGLLNSMDKNYKKTFLPSVRDELHVLNYNSKELNTEKVMEDLELLDFEDMSRFNDWRIRKETTINTYRRMYALNTILMAPSSYIDVPEYIWYGDELSKLMEILEEDPRYSQWQKSSTFGKMDKVYRDRNWL